MLVASMTGFSRKNYRFSLENKDYSWVWEIKSVNGKGLDLKTKLPYWLDAISLELKSKAALFFSRGNLSASLDLVVEGDVSNVKVNTSLMNLLAEKAIELYESQNGKLQKPTASEILAMKGVVENGEDTLSDDALNRLQNELIASFAEVCKNLQEDRCVEGEKIKVVLSDLLDKIESKALEAEKIALTLPEQIRQKLKELVDELAGEQNVSDERLAQEIVFFVNRSDVREELDRLKTHVSTARKMFEEGGVIGRRLDFLCQELNREANTMCSKSADAALTNVGMDLKTLIEQFREQVQNIE